jgi:hypothetical protein
MLVKAWAIISTFGREEVDIGQPGQVFLEFWGVDFL